MSICSPRWCLKLQEHCVQGVPQMKKVVGLVETGMRTELANSSTDISLCPRMNPAMLLFLSCSLERTLTHL